MRSFIAFPALAALAFASPVPQNIDFDLVDDSPDPPLPIIAVGPTAQMITYNLAAATTFAATETLATPESTPTADSEKRDLGKRAACATQPAGAGPVPSPDTASAFLAYPSFASIASAAPTPSGYSNTFTNLQGSSNAYGYLGYTTLSTYDTAKCAAKCSAINKCVGINIFYERDPTVDPGTGCTNPASTTVIKCTFWGGAVLAESALNKGQYRSSFQVVITGSNGYMSNTIASVPGFTGTSLPAAINAPLDCNGQDTYMGSKLLTTGVFDAGLCATACASQNTYNLQHPPSSGSPQLCKFFTTYLMSKNGVPQGQYCALYSQTWDPSYATNTGQWRGTDQYTVSYASSYSNTTDPGKPYCGAQPGDVSYLQTAGQDFCTSYLGYSAPTTTTTSTAFTTAAAVETDTQTVSASTTTTTTVTSTFTSTYSTIVATVTVQTTAPNPKKRDDGAVEYYSTTLLTVAPSIPASAIASHASVLSVLTEGGVQKRTNVVTSVTTPSSVSTWGTQRISEACSSIATGTFTSTATITSTVSTPTTTFVTATQVQTIVTVQTITATSTVTQTLTSTTTQVNKPTCSDFNVNGVHYVNYYSGSGYVENVNNPGNGGGRPPSLIAFFEGSLSTCEANRQCATTAYNQPGIYYSYDLHFRKSTGLWECVQYWDQNLDPKYFNVADSDVGEAYGYFISYFA